MKAYHWQRIVEERHAEELARGLPVQQPRPPIVANQPKVNTRKGPPLCVDCEFHSWSFEWMTGKIFHRCHDVMTRDPVTGAPTDPYMNRKSAISCGPQGTYWRIKKAPTKPREIEVLPDTEPMEYVPPVPVRMLTVFRDEQVVALFERPVGFPEVQPTKG